jgi:hypothetical protein
MANGLKRMAGTREANIRLAALLVQAPQFIVGIENCAPSLMPDGQRAVTVLVRV